MFFNGYTLNFWDYVIAIIIVLVLIYKYLSWKVHILQRKKLKTLPAYPAVGNIGASILKRVHLMDLITKIYLEFPREKYIGFYQFQTPFVLLRDIEIIKQITIKDFDHFQDHVQAFDDDNNPLFGRNLVNLSGKKWHDMRATLSPAFTSSKMKNMFIFINECSVYMSDFYTEKMKKQQNKGYVEVEMKDAYTRYTNDVIGTSAFGIKIDSFADENNTFYKLGRKLTTFSTSLLLKILFVSWFPKISKALNLKAFDPVVADFFRNLVKDQWSQRTINNTIRPDMIHLLMEAKKGSLNYEASNESKTEFATVEESNIGRSNIKTKWTDDDLIAQATLFFFAGFETSSNVLCFLSNELAINSGIQRKLQNEIDDTLIQNKGIVSYNVIQGMKYMDMVVSETLRKWPPAIATDRKCVKSYSLPATESTGKPYELNVGDLVWIPISAIHRDSNYYPNPNEFDPERFSDENKKNITPFSYLPFGMGPRNCIASRFALMEIKSVIFHLLSKFDFVPTSKTANPLVLDTKLFILKPKEGFWLGLKPRNLRST